MSLATLKKKTASKYNNNSVNTSGFSLNGKHRNQGYVGQTSLSRTILRTPAKGVTLQGNGSKYGYPIKELVTSIIEVSSKPSINWLDNNLLFFQSCVICSIL